jgi:hypothetical protein
MTKLIEKDEKFKWAAAYKAGFQELKKRLTTAPGLLMPDMEKAIPYSPAVEGYPDDLKLATVNHDLKIWWNYLMGKRCEQYTNHKSLKYIFTQPDLNLRHRRWLELIKDYDLGINYHLGKANVVADEFAKLKIVANTKVMEMEVDSSLLQEIHRGQLKYEKIHEIRRNIKEEKSPGFMEDDQGVLWYKGRICVPNIEELKDKILREAHESAYSIHLGGNNMYHDLKAAYW